MPKQWAGFIRLYRNRPPPEQLLGLLVIASSKEKQVIHSALGNVPKQPIDRERALEQLAKKGIEGVAAESIIRCYQYDVEGFLGFVQKYISPNKVEVMRLPAISSCYHAERWTEKQVVEKVKWLKQSYSAPLVWYTLRNGIVDLSHPNEEHLTKTWKYMQSEDRSRFDDFLAIILIHKNKDCCVLF